MSTPTSDAAVTEATLGQAPTSLDDALSGGLDGADTLAGLTEGQATDVQQVGLADLAHSGPGAAIGTGAGRDLRLLADIELELTVELGRARIPLRDLLSLTPGVVLELERAAGEPVDVLVNGRVVARGEVVVVDGDFGVRVNEITEQH